MNVRYISLLTILLLLLSGCGEKTPANETGTITSAVPTAIVKELTPEEKFAQMKPKAEAGDAQAQVDLGEMYENGKGVVMDDAKAIEWYQKSASQDNAQAQVDLGEMYAWGHGVAKDKVKAIEWYQKSAAQGNAKAQDNLGDFYRNGKVGLKHSKTKNTAKAMEWYQKAAAQGDMFAQESLGDMYRNGEGVYKDDAKAIEWYQKAAAQGFGVAQYDLGEMYHNGEGVPKDSAKAVEWYQKAAAQGTDIAQESLGLMYANGEGIRKNPVLAYAWFNLAAAQAPYYGENRDLYEAQLTPAQRAEGQRLASNWKKGDILQVSGNSESVSTSPDGKPTKQYTGTAFAVSSSGYALTNYHVVADCTEVKIAGREGVAKVITYDSVNDLALMQLPGNTEEIASLNPDLGKLRQGEDIIVFGYPLNSVLSSGGNLTLGTISALTGLGNNTNQIQITAPIQPGSSGSPVMDKKGNVVGVVSMKLDDAKMAKATGQIGQNVNFAVNGLTVKAFLDANKVSYKTSGGFFSREKSNADIAEEARKWTVLVECWK